MINRDEPDGLTALYESEIIKVVLKLSAHHHLL
jgi:hypothetical protein